MTDTPPNAPRDSATGMSQSGDLSGISEMFGLRDGQTADTGTRTGTDTVGRWVAATEGDALVPADASGRLVHGRYRLIAELGVGGMGVTYRAWDTTAGIPVVVKMPRREVRSDSEAMQRFAREIDAMLAVPHERIVPITDHGDDDGCPFVVMRFLPGGFSRTTGGGTKRATPSAIRQACFTSGFRAWRRPSTIFMLGACCTAT